MRISSVSSTTTRKMRSRIGSDEGASVMAQPRLPQGSSRITERKARQPAQQRRARHGREAVKQGAAQREFVEIGVEPDLGDNQRRRLSGDDVAVAHQQDFDKV